MNKKSSVNTIQEQYYFIPRLVATSAQKGESLHCGQR